ncbi:MAG: TaqI family restriction endonuclease [Candidatus Edwardsbacteria bacterium]
MRKNPIRDLEKYREFLETIPLDKYREELKNIKWVEQDLVSQLFPLKSIYATYWEWKNFLSFEDWFNKFWNKLRQNHSQKLKDLKELVRAHRKFYENKAL